MRERSRSQGPTLTLAARVTHDGFWSWQFPLIVGVLSGMFYARSQGATVLRQLIVGVAVLAIGGFAAWWLRHPALVHRHTPLLGRWLRITAPPRAKWQPPQVIGRQVYLPITNDGGKAQFSASLDGIEGTAERMAVPFPVRWREQDGERREVGNGETSLLYLACVEPEGNIDDYPVGYGAKTKHSVEDRVRHWRPGRFRFMGLSQEYVAYLDLGDVQPLTKVLRAERYERSIRVTVRLRSSDGVVNEAQTVALRIQEVGDSRHSWGAKDAVVATME